MSVLVDFLAYCVLIPTCSIKRGKDIPILNVACSIQFDRDMFANLEVRLFALCLWSLFLA